MDPFVYFVEAGVSYSIVNCPNCDHRTPADQTCPVCQPTPTQYRCYGCLKRGPVPTETITIGAVGQNDPPPGADVMNQGGQRPKGLNV